MKLFLFKLSTILLALLLFLVGLEITARVLNLAPPRLGQADPIYGYAHIPGSSLVSTSGVKIEIGAHGFRGPAPSLEKKPGTFRVVFLGDSFLFAEALPWNEVFTTRLNDSFQNQGLPIETINLGVNGYGTVQEYLVYRHLARNYRPDLVIVCFYAGNDLRDNYPPPEHLPGFELVGGELRPVSFTTPRRGPVRDFLRRRLRIYSYLPDLWRRAVNNSLFKFLGREEKRRFEADKAQFDWRPTGEWAPDVLGPEHLGPAWRLTLAVLEKLFREIQRDGGEPGLCVFPIVTQVYDRYWEALKRQYPARETETWDRFKPQKTLENFCRERHLPFFPVSRALVERARERQEEFYLEKDFHFNARAHRVLAEVLGPAIEKIFREKKAAGPPSAVGAL
ncbi:MAG: GDSL-type esterase/lipase family protein [Pseudomonadota bacterium]